MRGGLTIELTIKEFALLEYLLRHPNRLITGRWPKTTCGATIIDGASNVVDVYIRRLRRKVDDPFPIKLIETVRGAGYRLRKHAAGREQP